MQVPQQQPLEQLHPSQQHNTSKSIRQQEQQQQEQQQQEQQQQEQQQQEQQQQEQQQQEQQQPQISRPLYAMPADDKTPLCIPFILTHLQNHHPANPLRPLIIGLNGIQGAGKTTLARNLASVLTHTHGVNTLVFSLDDFYLTREEQLALARRNPQNALVQHRGEPGTHDTPLLTTVFTALADAHPTHIPRYDKALSSGQGDRLPPPHWTPVNQPGQPPLRLVIFEGWAVGFRPLPDERLAGRRETPSRTLRRHPLKHLLFVNAKLGDYEAVTHLLDAFIHIDAQDTDYVYAWRQEQEESLRRERGDPSAGMTPDEVVRFVDGYYPAYELYTERLSAGVFPDKPGCHLRIVVGRDRKVRQVVQM